MRKLALLGIALILLSGCVMFNFPTAPCSSCAPGEICCNNTCVAPACSNDVQCADADPCTADICANPKKCGAYCTHSSITITCSNDAQCGDGDPCTTDTCVNPGTYTSYCSNTKITPCCGNGICEAGETYSTCQVDCCEADCTAKSDSVCHVECNNYVGCTNFQTDCNSQPIASKVCSVGDSLTCCRQRTSCTLCCGGVCATPTCTGAAQCNDANACTNDACLNPGACTASCSNSPITPCCGNTVCEAGETYSSCPQDCCNNLCTAKSDTTCHSACNGYNGCTNFRSVCDGQARGAFRCSNAAGGVGNTYDSLCCNGAITSCSACLQQTATTVACGACTGTCPDGQGCDTCYVGDKPWYCNPSRVKEEDCTECGCPPAAHPTNTKCCPVIKVCTCAACACPI